MNDIETMKCHFHILLLYFTVYFILDGSPLEIFRHSWNNFHWYCVINTTCKHIWTCCITLRHFYLSPHFVLFFLIFTSCRIIYSGTPCPCVISTPCNSFLSTYSALHKLTLLYKLSFYTWYHSYLRRFRI